ncbi:hypothetical protein F5Y07DRAFT_271091 [Xylaria sp. FL0933]|nr:hypothetical protein F5Y07DRAFT_271091 [Xylaria sp. FL0933]
MQKILRRVATAERVAAKRKKARDLKFYKKGKKELDQQRNFQVNQAREEVEAAKQTIRDDWAMGPLAPRTDVGEWHDAFGAIRDTRMSSGNPFPLALRNARCQWAGGAYYLNLAVGDRVVLLDGPDKGRIGQIQNINHETAEATIKDLNKANVLLNEFIRTDDQPAAANIELPLPISAIRLVHPITDPATHQTRDVIINQLIHSNLVTDRLTGKRRWDRVVPGLNIAIPWPAKEEPPATAFKADTLRLDAEERTFVPTLLRPPMPEAVVDELRGRYSRFRTRHEPAYVARLEAEEAAKKERQKLMESMRTPLQELHRAERANKKKKGKPRLTLEMLEKIGEVIAKNRERTLNAAGAGVSGAVPSRTTSPSLDVPPPASTNADLSPPPPST